jgi:hypothetical protein
MITAPKGDVIIKFDKGGVAITRLPASVYLVFFTSLNRMITETGVQSYTINDKDISDMITRCWNQASQFCPAKVFSRPDAENVENIVSSMKELIEK